MTEPWFPLSADIRVVLVVFAFLLLAFDLILVRWCKLNKVAWKRVEYVWLGFAALGLFGAVSQVRVSVAHSQKSMFEERTLRSFEAVRHLTGLLSSNPGVLCRTFIRSEFSPPSAEFDKVQNEYNQACQWIKDISSQLPKQMESPPTIIQSTSLKSPPKASSADLNDIIDGVYRQLGYYNDNARVLNGLIDRTKRNTIDDALMLLGPYFLAIALALRISKVTGEIGLESGKKAETQQGQ